MTIEEAMGYLQTLANRIPLKFYTNKGYQIYDDFSQVTIQALEKQIPIELEKQGFFKVCKCGCEMSTFLMHNRANYCPKCGQAIKWE